MTNLDTAPSTPDTPRPGRSMILSGITLIALAVVLGIASLAFFAFSIWQMASDDMLARDLVPGTIDVQFDEPGEYVICYEYRSTVDGRTIHTSEQPPNLDYELRSPTGDTIPLEPYATGYSYENPTRQGFAIFQFQIQNPGSYELHVTNDTTQDQYVIAVGQPRIGVLLLGMASFFCGGGLATILLILGVVLLIVGLVRRSRG